MKTAQVRPSSTSQKYSNELNLSANSASVGAADHQHRGAEQAADGREHEPGAERDLGLALAASSRRPRRCTRPMPACRACASRQPGMSPEKIAIAVAVTIAAIAGIGAMKNVTGTSSAVAIVAVSPGTAPTNRPNSEAASITTTLYGSKTSREGLRPTRRSSTLRSPRDPLQHAPRQRHAQQLVERVVDERASRSARPAAPAARRTPEHPESAPRGRRRGEQKPEPVDRDRCRRR